MKLKQFGSLYAALLLSVFTLFTAAIFHRPFLGETSTWYYRLISEHRVFYDKAFYRYADSLLHLPSLFLVNISPDFNIAAIYTLHFIYLFHPIVSLAFVHWILKKKGRPDLFLFPVLSFATATMPALGESITMAALALSIFWPLFFLILFRNSKSKRELVTILCLFAMQIFSYEPAILFFMIFSGIALSDIFLFKKNSRAFNRLVIALSVAGTGLMTYVITSPRRQHALPAFFESFKHNFDGYRTFCLFSLLLFIPLVSLVFLKRERVKKVTLTFLLGAFVANCFYFLSRQSDELWGPYVARTTAIPFGFFIAVFCYVFFRKQQSSEWIGTAVGRAAVSMLTLMVLASSLYDWNLTKRWNQHAVIFHNLVNDSAGCRHISKADMRADFAATPAYAFAAQSVLFQVLDKVDPIRTLIFFDDKSTQRNPCDNFEFGEFTANQGSSINIEKSYLKFSEKIFKK